MQPSLQAERVCGLAAVDVVQVLSLGQEELILWPEKSSLNSHRDRLGSCLLRGALQEGEERTGPRDHQCLMTRTAPGGHTEP